ncbi:cbb3-type cytochrome oxidase assembly protein CcoS [Acuticoccus sp. MNP-M23]|uniref:cbb3-type cytochrome oxidase assembly protein CcoS n=1 Tax=Acuticoccus sp. MNP-M23 TaxID=3072793 RepID=UPI002815DCF3|nr:cbb3-type cytochrome oxidase assembly protein CcoS [Acuticoccus sp. MNP-M23]WMS44126.1 cbb3-type cytochrome oxidase assembly protein CcoS [Acuticoccus sp. MNP-M23]
MNILVILVPAALFLGLVGLGAFFWCIRTDQFEDMDGAANRILGEDRPPAPSPPRRHRTD